MKVALSTYGKNWRDQIDIRLGRAGGFFVVDTSSEKTSFIENRENVLSAHSAGTRAAQHLVDAGIEVLITGKVGLKGSEVLKAGNIKVLGGVGYMSIKEAYALFKNGKLKEQQFLTKH